MLPPNERRSAHADATASQGDQTFRLHEMQQRLAELSTEVGSIRAQLPRDYEPDVECIQQQMEFLRDRLAELNAGSAPPSAQTTTSEAGLAQYCDEPHENTGKMAGRQNKVSQAETKFEQHDVSASSGTVEPAHPWDEASVAALVRLYESGEASIRGETPNGVWASSRPAPKKQGRATSIEPAQLEQRFAEIAQRIEGSLAQIRPESSLSKLGQRFDQLEERMSSALDGVATRAEVEELLRAEVQVEEITAQLGQFRAQLSRLDTIDAHLGTLTRQLSDEKMSVNPSSASSPAIDTARLDAVDAQLASIAEQLSDERFSELTARHAKPMPDLEGLAAAAAAKTVQSLAKHERWEAQSHELGEVRGLVENLINERRINDENNASMLETMQQVVIRILNRVDSLELEQQSAVPETVPSEQAPAEPELAPAASPKESDHARSYVSLTHPQPEPETTPELSTSSGSEANEPRYVSLTHPQPKSEAEPEFDTELESDPEPDFEPSQSKAFAGLGEETMHEPPPFLRSEGKPSYVATLDDCTDEPYTPPGSPPVSMKAALTPSAFFGITSEPEPDAASGEAVESMPAEPSIDEMRHNLIAKARWSKLTAMSMQEETVESEELIASNDDSEGPKPKRASRKFGSMILPSAGMSAWRALVGALALVIILPVAYFLMPRLASDADGVAIPDAVHSFPALQGDSEPGARGTGSGSEVAPAQTNKTPAAAEPEGEIDNDAGEADPMVSPARVDTAIIPRGIVLQAQAKPSPIEFAWAQKAPGTASLPNPLDIAVANERSASLLQEYTSAPHAGSDRPNGLMPTGAGSSLKLPREVGSASLRKAAAQGVASAQFEVGARFAKGDVTDQNLEAAARWYQRAASQGFAMAQYRLATLYERGLGVEADLARAQVWYGRAARQGNLKAMHNLAVLSIGGQGRTADYTVAAQWFSQAAEHGLADSQYNIGVLYESGLGVRRDLKQAYKWMLLASKAGDKQTERRRKTLSAKLSKKDRAEAEKLADRWRAKVTDPMFNDARVAGQAWQRSAARS